MQPPGAGGAHLEGSARSTRASPRRPRAPKRYLEQTFGEALEDARDAMTALARSLPEGRAGNQCVLALRGVPAQHPARHPRLGRQEACWIWGGSGRWRRRSARDRHRGTQPHTRLAIVGTAGHIDHGKTALVRRLTGVDTDRLPEEKQRGISIDLGFAPLVTPAGVQRRHRGRARARALRQEHAGRRRRHRPGAAGDRRRRRRDAADARAPGDRAAARHLARHRGAHEERPGRARVDRGGGARRARAARGHAARRKHRSSSSPP